ncbi:MAG: tRNA (cytidine(34)-2'-O)-methyltransferase [Panacagrimonas sp.]
MFHIVLHEPQIPPNTGNLIRLAANTGCRLHLIRPLGFHADDRSLRRAGLDYHELACLQIHDDLDAWRETFPDARLWAFSTRAKRCYSDVRFGPGDALMFGSETSGLPADLLASLPPEQCLRIPMLADSRSLNLANSAAIAVYEAWRQNDFSDSKK